VDDLIAAYSSSGVVPDFARRSRELIWQVSAGNPREIQRLCQGCAAIAILRAKGGGSAEVQPDILVEAIAHLYDMRAK
jgi:hypothetical protein